MDTTSGVRMLVLDTKTKSCDECRRRHRSCNQGVPACARCTKLGIECRRQTGAGDVRWLRKSRAGLRPAGVVPVSWSQAIDACAGDWITRYYMRRYLMPLAPLLPKPTAATELSQLQARAVRLGRAFRIEQGPVHCPLACVQAMLGTAVKAFFRLFNPFYPLFSEEDFFLKPRSAVLMKIVIQMGLERMPESDLTRAAASENGLTTRDLDALPLSLDTLQCHVLTLFGLWSPRFRKITARLAIVTRRLVPLLGLHLPSRACLERRLAYQMLHYGLRHMGVSYCMALFKFTHFEPNSEPGFVQGPPSCARIHAISSHATYTCFLVVLSAHKAHARAQAEGLPFLATLRKHLRRLDQSFAWGWRQLSAMGRHRALRTQSQLTLALRYHSDYIELAKLGLDDKAPHSDLWQGGLQKAIATVRLVATINPYAFDFDYLRVLIPAVTFLMLSCRKDGAQAVSLCLARECLSRAREVPFLRFSANCYLELFDYLIKQNKILLPTRA